jgi:uncharacterized protein YjiS (DUF1127 family)
MRTHVGVQSEPLVRGRPASEDWARIDPIVYVSEARRAQARALAEALSAGWRGLRRGLSGLAALTRRHIVQPLARRSERRRAIAQLTGLDGRLLADIGLRRSDIELAVDGLLADPRVTRRTPAPAAVVSEKPLDRPRRPVPAATATANRPAQPDRIADLAA